jgi:DNA-binding PadR family transcriptional regulator
MFNDLWGLHSDRHGHVYGWHAARRGGHGGRGSWGRSGPPDGMGDFFGPPPRAERGGVRYLVLDAIATQPRHGYEIIQAIEERSTGSYRPSPGVIYPTLQLLEELGHARVIEQETRKAYAITEAGQKDLDEHRDEVADFYERSGEDSWLRQIEDFRDLMREAARLFKSFKRAARRGRLTSKAQSGIRDVIEDAVKRIETILRDDER